MEIEEYKKTVRILEFCNKVLEDKLKILKLENKELKEQFVIIDAVSNLPSKDAVICEGYNKAKNEDYKNRNSLKHKSQDDYYSGWMDCYDFLNEK